MSYIIALLKTETFNKHYNSIQLVYLKNMSLDHDRQEQIQNFQYLGVKKKGQYHGDARYIKDYGGCASKKVRP